MLQSNFRQDWVDMQHIDARHWIFWCRDFDEHTKSNAKSVKEMQALADSYDKAVTEVCPAFSFRSVSLQHAHAKADA